MEQQMNRYLKAAGLIHLVKKINAELNEFGLMADVVEIPQEQPKQAAVRTPVNPTKGRKPKVLVEELPPETAALLKTIKAHTAQGVTSRTTVRKVVGRHLSSMGFAQRLRRLRELGFVEVSGDLIRVK